MSPIKHVSSGKFYKRTTCNPHFASKVLSPMCLVQRFHQFNMFQVVGFTNNQLTNTFIFPKCHPKCVGSKMSLNMSFFLHTTILHIVDNISIFSLHTTILQVVDNVFFNLTFIQLSLYDSR